MKEETRKPLKTNTKLMISVNSNTRLEIVIGNVIAYGGSCIAYDGMLVFNDNRPVIIKEYYPSSQDIMRDDITGRLIIPDEERFNQRKDFFKKGISRASRLFSEILVKDIFIYGDCDKTNTVYGVSLKGDGCTLKELAEKESLSISRIADIMASLCEAVSKVHEKGFFYLDAKPENTYCSSGDKVQLFDFDTCIADSEAHSRSRVISYSMGWAAPEQLPSVMEKEYFEVSRKSDVFSIGACFFWLLSGEKPYTIWDDTDPNMDFSIIKSIERGSFDYRKNFNICKHVDKVVLQRIQTIIRGTLSYSPNDRDYNTVNDLKDDFLSLSRISSIDNRINRTVPAVRQSINRFNYDSGLVDFFGRKNEMHYLLSACEEDNDFCWLSICGEAGSGKTRLAYELCKEMEKREWQVFWPSHASSNISRIERYLDTISRDTLICFDDATTNSDVIIDFIYLCSETPVSNGCRVRVLLIDRNEKEMFTRFAEVADYQCARRPYSGCICIPSLEITDVEKIIQNYAVNAFEDELSTQEIKEIIDAINGVWDSWNPLYVLFSVDAWCHGDHIWEWDRETALEYLQKRELHRIKSIVYEVESNKISRTKCFDEIKQLIVAASFLDGCRLSIIRNRKIDVDKLRWILDKCNLYDSKLDIIKPMKPDLFAEYVCITILRSMPKQCAEDLIVFLLREDYWRVLSYGVNLFNDYCEKHDPLRIVAPFKLLEWETEDTIVEYVGKSLSPEEIDEFDNVSSRGAKEAYNWLDTHCPDYPKLVNQAINEVKEYVLSHLFKVFWCGESSNKEGNYEGEFVLFWRCGKGEMHYKNGDYYSGEWFDDLPNGEGKLIKKGGSVFSGTFSDGDLFMGKLVFPDNTIIKSSFWNKGKVTRAHPCYFSDGREYEGDILPNLPIPNGYGVLTNLDGSFRSGFWINGMPIDRIEQYLLPKTTIEKRIVNKKNINALLLFTDAINEGITYPNSSIYSLKQWSVPWFFEILNDPTGKFEKYQDIESLMVDGFGCIRKD